MNFFVIKEGCESYVYEGGPRVNRFMVREGGAYSEVLWFVTSSRPQTKLKKILPRSVYSRYLPVSYPFRHTMQEVKGSHACRGNIFL